MPKFFIAILLFISGTIKAQPVYITVKAGAYQRSQTIVTAALKHPLPKGKAYQLVNTTTGKTAVAQLADATHVLFLLPDILPPGSTATYKLIPSAMRKAASPITVEESANGLLVKVAGKKVLFYNTAIISPPDSLPSFYARSGFIHPLFSPSGKVLTDDFPVGHAHQHGIMTAWASTTFRGAPLDFWNQQQQTGSVKHVAVEGVTIGAVAATIKLRLQQYSLAHGAVLTDRWTITIYPFSGRAVFDLRSHQQNITADTLYINKYHYGSIAFRGIRQWNDADSSHFKGRWNVANDGGDTLTNADGKPAAYVSAWGAVDGVTAGVTVFGFPTNFRYPQPIRVHPQMPYWGFAPAAPGSFTINPGGVYTSAYRYVVYDGPPDTTTLQNMNNDLVHPPEVTVSNKR